jgi:hypothetical protein
MRFWILAGLKPVTSKLSSSCPGVLPKLNDSGVYEATQDISGDYLT